MTYFWRPLAQDNDMEPLIQRYESVDANPGETGASGLNIRETEFILDRKQRSAQDTRTENGHPAVEETNVEVG